jgi:hypothetical protein
MDAEQVLFAYKEEQISALELTLSSPRLAKYLQGASGDKEAALKRYVLNTSISEAFYTPLQGLEVTLRNGLSAQLPRVCREDWFVAGASSLLLHPLPDMLSEAAGKLAEDRKPVTGPNVIAELSFGFWVTILGPDYETHIWRQGLRHAFPNRPAGIERKQIQGGLNRIRRLRNRIAHHEPILDRKLAFDHDLTIGLTSWMCRETAKWVKAHSRVSQTLAAAGWQDPI